MYGFSPTCGCGAPGISRERRPEGGYDRCDKGHTYPSCSALRDQPSPLVLQAQKQASFQTDPAWAEKIVADAAQLDEIRRLGT